MRRFLQLLQQLEPNDCPEAKSMAMLEYFQSAPMADAHWAIFFLCGRKLEGRISSQRLRKWLLELTDWPEWMVDTCQIHTGNLAETASLMLPQTQIRQPCRSLHQYMNATLRDLHLWDERVQLQLLRPIWNELDRSELCVFHRLITGVNIAKEVREPLILALAEWSGLSPAIIARRLEHDWQPTPEFIKFLRSPATDKEIEEVNSASLNESSTAKNPPAPKTLDLVLIYAIAPNRRRSGQFTGYAFAARNIDDKSFITVTKATSQLSEVEKSELDQWIQKQTQSAKGPVRSVPAERVYQIIFDNIQPSPRHKCGYALSNPRIKQFHHIPAEEAATIQEVAAICC